MLKGKSIIELTNVKTGEVRRYENENLVTNAAAMYLQLCMAMGNYKYFRDNLPLYNHILGGLLIWDNTLEEDPNNVYWPDPTVAKMVGHASIVASGDTNPARGHKSLSESCEITNGYRYVYEFGTNEANGTIRSLSLTHSIAGYYGYNLPIRALQQNEMAFAYNNDYSQISLFSAGQLSGIKIKKSSTGALSYVLSLVSVESDRVKVEKYTVPVSELKINEKIGTPPSWGGGVYELVPEYYPAPEGGIPEYSYYNICCEDENFYYCFNHYDYYTYIDGESKTRWKYIVINKSTRQMVIKYFITPKQSAWNSSYQSFCPVVRGGYGYFVMADNKIIKVNLMQQSGQQDITVVADGIISNSNETVILGELENGTIISNSCIIDKNDNIHSIYPMWTAGYCYENYNYNLWRIFKGIVFTNLGRYGESRYAIPSPFYLGTINNLETPVTKTDQESMKITYELVSTETYTEPQYEGYGNAV